MSKRQNILEELLGKESEFKISSFQPKEWSEISSGGRVYISGTLVKKNLVLLKKRGLLFDTSSNSWWYPESERETFRQIYLRLTNKENVKEEWLRDFISKRAKCFFQEVVYVAELARAKVLAEKQDAVFLLKEIYGCYDGKHELHPEVSGIVFAMSKRLGSVSAEATEVIARTISVQYEKLQPLSLQKITERVEKSSTRMEKEAERKFKTQRAILEKGLKNIESKLQKTNTGKEKLLSMLVILPLEEKEKFYNEAGDIIEKLRTNTYFEEPLNLQQKLAMEEVRVKEKFLVLRMSDPTAKRERLQAEAAKIVDKEIREEEAAEMARFLKIKEAFANKTVRQFAMSELTEKYKSSFFKKKTSASKSRASFFALR